MPDTNRPPAPPPQVPTTEGMVTTVEDDQLGPPKADFSAPPPYEPEQQSQQQQQHQHQQEVDAQNNMNNTIMATDYHGKLPTYEEVQMEKCLNGELPPGFLTISDLPPLPPPNPLLPPNMLHDGSNLSNLPPLPPPNPLLPMNMLHDGTNLSNLPPMPPPNPLLPNRGRNAGRNRTQQPALTFIAIDASDTERQLSNTDRLLGTDLVFISAFLISFILNWIGFLMVTCFCHTIAARYGALSGFGLSLAKWTMIVKHSTDLASHENTWLWWLIMAFGFLICVRALIQYVSIKRSWHMLSRTAQERFLFFY